ncbi:selenocysteine lyase/cysteine desulfurase [Roseateles toxinivorans]|uniref:Selenocysteine lyase/cysteine desulfurase n=2 Tax=Roseateles toxinivorans TaxID=270368 RepID=A0A4R6QJ94_9BURK|nr:selenocysteine lyase/cysteine desulfurase [Roseateles toxinivorans]
MLTELITGLRLQTPGLAQGLHFNNGGAGLPSQATLDAVIGQLQLEARLGPMEAAAAAQEGVDRARANAARLINASVGEIAFASSGSSALGLAVAALLSTNKPLQAGERILVGRQEWGGSLATYQRIAQRTGATVEVIPCREDGSVDPEALAPMLDARVRLVSLTWLPANGGLINDAAAIGRITRAAGVPYLIDAGQAVGQLPVDVQALGCDILKSAGRKHLRGPRGTALLYVRQALLEQLEPVFVDVQSAAWTEDQARLRSDAQMFETSESSLALTLGLGAALELATRLDLAQAFARVQRLAEQLREALRELPGITVQDLGGPGRSGLVSFTVAGIAAAEVKRRLALQNIEVGANGVPYTPLDMQARGLDGIVRATLSYLNTEDEVQRLVEALARLKS